MGSLGSGGPHVSCGSKFDLAFDDPELHSVDQVTGTAGQLEALVIGG
jgi:hypothetical protein